LSACLCPDPLGLSQCSQTPLLDRGEDTTTSEEHNGKRWKEKKKDNVRKRKDGMEEGNEEGKGHGSIAGLLFRTSRER